MASQSCGRSFDNVCFDILANVGVSRAAGRRREQESGGKERPEKVAPRLGLRQQRRAARVVGRLY